MMKEEQNNSFPHQRYRTEHKKPKADFVRTRNILNLIFMLGAIVGVIFYLFANENIGIIIILVAMGFKLVECALRLFH
jgi:hypothetical protein